MNPLAVLDLLDRYTRTSARHIGDQMVYGCGIVVPCPRFDGDWGGDPLGLPVEPNPLLLDTEWAREVTRAWREHPILKEGT